MMSMQAIAKTLLAIAAIVLSVTACSSPVPQTSLFIPPTTTQAPQTQPTHTSTPAPTIVFSAPTRKLPQHRIGIRVVNGSAEFYDQQLDTKFVPRGVNYFYIVPVGSGFEDRVFGVGVYDHDRMSNDLKNLRQHGFNTVRMFLDSCGIGPSCIAYAQDTGLNPAYLDDIVDVMRLAKAHGISLLLTSNDLPHDSAYWKISDRDSGSLFEGYRNAHYLTPSGIESARLYWRDLMSGLAERAAPFDAVLGWSLLNEQWFFETQPPLSLKLGSVKTANGKTYNLADPLQKREMLSDGVTYYIDQVRPVIIQYDPTALITMGFFVPAFPNSTRVGDGWYDDTVPLLSSASLDFFDFHAYPNSDIGLPKMAENFGMNGYAQKPIIMGEVGAFISAYPSIESATRVTQSWIAQSCDYGFDGWLYWGYYRAPQAIGDATWGFVDENGMLMNALAPINQPDACITTQLPSSDLAFGKSVRASKALPKEPASNAVDGTAAQWGSGDFAPQWIEIDLGAPSTIKLIRLTTAQYPSGETVHQIWGAGPGEDLRLVHEFRGSTTDNQVLEFKPPAPISGIQRIRIVTVQSPSWVSWKEIEIIAP